MANIGHIQHLKSSVVVNGEPKLPVASALTNGEIAINYAAGFETISIKNSESNIVRFSSDNYFEGKVLSGYVTSGDYNSESKEIELKNGDAVLATIDATAFIKDGMVDTVVIRSGGNLVITFNTDAGKEDISIPLSDIFDPSNYYNKTEADETFATINSLDALSSDLETVSGSVTSISESLADLEGEVYAKSEIDAFLADKQDVSGMTAYTTTAATDELNTVVTAHTADTVAHVTAEDKAAWNASLSGVEFNGNAATVTDNVASVSADGSNINLSDSYTGRSIVEESVDVAPVSGDSIDTAFEKVVEIITKNEEVTAAALTDLDARLIEVSGTVTGMSADKVDTTAFTEHTASTVHMSATEKENLDSLATNIATISGITAADITSWNAKQDAADMTGYTTTAVTDALNTVVTAHTADTVAHVTAEDKAAWNASLSAMSVNSVVATVANNEASVTVYGDDITLGEDYDGAVIKDENDNVVSPVSSDTINASVKKIVDIITENEEITAAALTDLDARVIEVSGTVTGMSSDKVDTTAFTAHTASTVHMSATEKENLDSLAINIATISGITAADITSWNAKQDAADMTGYTTTAVTDALNTVVTAHTADTNVHVDASEKAKIANALTGVTWNGSAVTITSSVAAIAGDGASIKLSDSYDGEAVTNSGVVVTPVSGDTVDSAVKKIVSIILENEDVIASALNELNSNKQDASGMTEYVTTAITNALNSVLSSHTANTDIHVTTSDKSTWDGKQNALVSGTNIKTINNQSILGSGNMTINLTVDTALSTGSSNAIANSAVTTALNAKVSATDFDTKLGSGFTGSNSGNTVTQVIEDNELVVSQSLNELYQLISDLTNRVTTLEQNA